ncbi:MAG: hypothetical protein B7X81_11530 [Hydrogenophilales bacterium 17-61-76]|nr:MAG: hypothetical protein B7Z03_14610 [Hydrogenophilales bacterium 32-62-9]OYZ56933.1 MAG: hypothetical protein B7Y21_09380 [Hydrogenophilales bacterium 16-61-112]OZA43271.1 MAG: hypothetical protein B7X81_11530 [Hydrogenophilales bacterium 17-61-76]
MLAYFLVSVGSVLLSMRTNISYFFGLMSLLYIFIAIGLVMLFINLMLTMPKPLNQDYFVQAGETDALSARQEGGHVLSLWRQLVSPDVLVDYAMLGTLDAEKRDAHSTTHKPGWKWSLNESRDNDCSC